jgi:hypothetical protein
MTAIPWCRTPEEASLRNFEMRNFLLGDSTLLPRSDVKIEEPKPINAANEKKEEKKEEKRKKEKKGEDKLPDPLMTTEQEQRTRQLLYKKLDALPDNIVFEYLKTDNIMSIYSLPIEYVFILLNDINREYGGLFDSNLK